MTEIKVPGSGLKTKFPRPKSLKPSAPDHGLDGMIGSPERQSDTQNMGAESSGKRGGRPFSPPPCGEGLLPRAEPRWDADRRAPSAEGAAVPAARQVGLQRLSAFHILSFLSVLLFVLPDLIRQSIGPRSSAWTTGSSPVVTKRERKAKRASTAKRQAPPLPFCGSHSPSRFSWWRQT